MIQSHFKNIRAELLERLNEANKEIIIAVYWFTNRELFDALVAIYIYQETETNQEGTESYLCLLI